MQSSKAEAEKAQAGHPALFLALHAHPHGSAAPARLCQPWNQGTGGPEALKECCGVSIHPRKPQGVRKDPGAAAGAQQSSSEAVPGWGWGLFPLENPNSFTGFQCPKLEKHPSEGETLINIIWGICQGATFALLFPL